MAKKKTERQKLSDQLRDIMLNGELSRYAIAKASGVDAGQIHRFVNGRGEMTFRTLDKIGDVLKLRFVIED